jgi:hypothetical protein
VTYRHRVCTPCIVYRAPLYGDPLSRPYLVAMAVPRMQWPSTMHCRDQIFCGHGDEDGHLAASLAARPLRPRRHLAAPSRPLVYLRRVRASPRLRRCSSSLSTFRRPS